MLLRGGVELAPGHSRLRAPKARGRVDADPLHGGHVDRDPAVGELRARDSVATGAHRDLARARAREVDRRDHVGRVLAAHDRGRALVHHRIEDRARLVIAPIAGREDLALDRCAELLYRSLVEYLRGHLSNPFRRSEFAALFAGEGCLDQGPFPLTTLTPSRADSQAFVASTRRVSGRG